ncbi:MAG: class I SAM-dependent methyltransferase [Hyphomicrobium sp.]
MSSFSPEWLALREPADVRARNRDVAAAVSAWFALRKSVRVVDLGSGTGANLRATSGLLPDTQHWTLVDKDASLIAAQRRQLRAWADACDEAGDDLILRKGSATLTVASRQLDLAVDLDDALAEPVDLVTASALFDLVSGPFIHHLARRVAERRAAFLAVITFNGVARWSPHRPADNAIAAAFNRHQMSDKGFGAAAGPLAAGLLADQFRLEGYSVLEGDSPWLLQARDRMLLDELQRGYAMTALETRQVDAKTVETWVKVNRNGADIGHTDTFAVPT